MGREINRPSKDWLLVNMQGPCLQGPSLKHMTSIILRTVANSVLGFGHLARTLRLEAEFRSRGLNCAVAVDHVTDVIRNLYSDVDFVELYADGKFSNEALDFEIFCTVFNPEPQTVVVLDDYRLGMHWENCIRPKINKLVVLDDNNNRKHNCDFLIDTKWQGEATYDRYDGLVNLDCIKLLGPKYLLLDPEYSSARPGQRIKNSAEFNILVNIGGGGDWVEFKDLLEGLIEQFITVDNISIKVLQGPFSKGREYVTSLAQNYDFVVPVGPFDSLATELSNTDLVISAAGGTLFEAMVLKVPTVSFSMTSNQENNPEYLEQLGHFFSLGDIKSVEQKKLAELCGTLVADYERVRKLTQQPCLVEIDAAGASRVVDNILGKLPKSSANSQQIGDCTPSKKRGRQIQKICDAHINLYRRSRNIPSNLNKMTQTKPVSELDHYLWWFKENQRTSFVSTKDDHPEIIFWHQVVELKSQEYLIGGWFACQIDTTGSAAVFALKEQLAYTDFRHPGLRWVAVIHKSNKFVFKLNQMFGFVEAQIDSECYSAAQTFFPKANPNDFHFVYRN